MLIKLSNDDIISWTKKPENIFSGTILFNDKIMYANIFSPFVQSPKNFLESTIFTNIDILKNKNIGYITEDQRVFAEILEKIANTCYVLASRQIELFPSSMLGGFETTINRMWKARFIREILKPYVDMKVGGQCMMSSSGINIVRILGNGSFGVVYLSESLDSSHQFAIKMTIDNITKSALANPYSQMEEGWDEINLLRPYISSIVEKGICPNFCYMYESFICNTCNFEGLKPKKSVACANIAMEFANGGTLENWKMDIHSELEQYGAIFQCMAGIHASQKYYQISNNDIKDLNILVSNCNPGGYWEYVIMGKSYYIPNNGSVFLVNDYGIGSCYDLDLPVCKKIKQDTGKKSVRTLYKTANFRPFIIIDNKLTPIKYNIPYATGIIKIDGKNFYPVICYQDGEKHTKYASSHITSISNIKDYSVTLTQEQIKILVNNGLSTDATDPLFFSNSEIVPYLDMFVDTQDVIKMFIGGIKKANKYEIHSDMPNISISIKSHLNNYTLASGILGGKNFNSSNLKPSNILAGYFIKDFFGEMFSQKPSGNLIQRFVI